MRGQQQDFLCPTPDSVCRICAWYNQPSSVALFPRRLSVPRELKEAVSPTPHCPIDLALGGLDKGFRGCLTGP